MWMPILIICTALYAESCAVVTGEKLLGDKESCFFVSKMKAREALAIPNIYVARPFCQIIPGTESSKEI